MEFSLSYNSDIDSESTSTSSDCSEVDMALSLNQVRRLELDLVKVLFGKEAADDYIKISNNDPHVDAEDFRQSDLLSTNRFSELTETIETMTFTGTVSIDDATSPALISDQFENQITKEEKCCANCCGPSQKISAKQLAPFSQYSLKYKSPNLLPPKDPKDKKKITLVLDIDETLIHSSFIATPNTDFHFYLSNEMSTFDIYVCVRPGVKQFITTLSKYYELVAFTSASKNYADQILNVIDPNGFIKFRLYRESCMVFNGTFVKDLSKLGRDLRKVIIVDNSPSCYMLQPYNALAIPDWTGNLQDKELSHLCDYLVKIYKVDNVIETLSSHSI